MPGASPEAVASLGADIAALGERQAALETGLAELEQAPAPSAPGGLASGAVLGLAVGQFRDALFDRLVETVHPLDSHHGAEDVLVR